MPRRRLAVALLLPAPVTTEVDGLRRAIGGDRERVAPHITLVPPVNVREEDVPAALALVREAAAASGSLDLEVGPPATFHPVNPVVYLAVGGGGLDALVALRRALLRPPLERRIDLPFVPHVTLDDDHPPDAIPARVSALAGYHVDVTITHVDLLEDRAPGPHQWNPIATVRLGPARRGDPRP